MARTDDSYPKSVPMPIFHRWSGEGDVARAIFSKPTGPTDDSDLADRPEVERSTGYIVIPHVVITKGLVWHYTDPAGAAGILTAGEIWASSVLVLNDAQELEYGLKVIANVVEDAISSACLRWRKYLEDLKKAIQIYLPKGGSFVACASLVEDSLSQWRSYGGQGAGYALALDVGESLAVVGRGENAYTGAIRRSVSTSGWMPVLYDPDEQRSHANEMLAYALVLIDSGSSAEDFVPEFIKAALCMKHPAFRDEREARYVVTSDVDWVTRFRGGPFGVTPYLGLTNVPASGQSLYVEEVVSTPSRVPLAAIRVAPGPSSGAAQAGVEHLLRASGQGSVPVLTDSSPIRWS